MRVALLGLLLVGCGFSGPAHEPSDQPDAFLDPTGDATTSGATMTPHIMITQLVTAECEKAFLCRAEYPSNANHSFDYEWGTSLSNCLTTDVDYKDLPAIDAAITAGRITFDPSLASACLLAPGIPAQCSALFSDTFDWSDTCYNALAGHVADGAACTTGWECTLTSICRQSKCVPAQ